MTVLESASEVKFTYFQSVHDVNGRGLSLTLHELGNWDASLTATNKDELPLIKLASFDGTGCCVGNVIALHGIEIEHDGESVQPEKAVQRLREAGIRAVIYTSPSHRPDAPRWRVLLPFAQPHALPTLTTHLGRILGIMGEGWITVADSSTRARRWYVGSVQGGQPVQHWTVDGQPLDTMTQLTVLPLPASIGGNSIHQPLGTPSLAAPSFGAAVEALNAIDPNDLGYDAWQATTAAYRQASASHDAVGIARAMWNVWCSRYEKNNPADNEKCWKSFDRGTSAGWNALCRRAEIVPGLRQDVAIPAGQAAPSQEVLTPLASLTRDNTTGAPSPLAVVQQLADWTIPIAFDAFAGEITITAPLSYAANPAAPRPLSDADYTAIMCMFNAVGQKPALATVQAAVELYAQHHAFNPVVAYLDALQWDGTARLDSWLTTYIGAEPSEWTQLIGPKVLISMVARAMQPGCKVDTMLILEGAQGLLKSTAAETLAGALHFGDQLPDMHDKDALQYMAGKWIVEIGELAAMRKSEVEEVKRFIVAKTDKFRPPYGRNMVTQPRTCIFIGTTNASEYLKDQTGNRRFWPVQAGMADIAALQRDRDQLLAEAVHRYRAGERWWLDGAENDMAADEQDKRTESHEWEGIIANAIVKRRGLPFTTLDAVGWVGHHEKTGAGNPSVTKPIADILKKLGYKQTRPRRDNSDRKRYWSN